MLFVQLERNEIRPEMLRLSRSEATLFLIPLLLVPLAIVGRKWKLAHTPKPHFLKQISLSSPPPNLYSNHWAQVETILPSPDGKVIYTGEKSKVKFHSRDARSGRLIRSFGVFHYGNADAVLSPDGKILGFGYGGWNGDRIVLFHTASGKEKLQLPKPKAVGYGFDLNNEVVAVPDNDYIRLFSVKNGDFVGKLQHRVRDFYPKRPRFSSDGKQLLWIGSTSRDFNSYANGHSNDEIVWFDWKKQQRIHAIEFSHTDLFNARFSGDGKVILATGFRRYWVKSRATKSALATDTLLFAVDAQSGKQLYSRIITDWPNEIAVSPDGKWFAFPSPRKRDVQGKQSFSIYAVRSGKEMDRIQTDYSPAAAWSADSKTLYLDLGTIRRIQQNGGRWNFPKR